MKSGLENNPPSYNDLESDCPNCGSEGTLSYSTKDIEVDEDTGETVLVEGLLCATCNDIYMSLDESVRFLNLKARRDGSVLYYGIHDGDIKETRLQ